jgi:hypothetical protein
MSYPQKKPNRTTYHDPFFQPDNTAYVVADEHSSPSPASGIATQGLTAHLQLHERNPVRLEKCVLIYCAASTGEAPAANR